MLAEGTYTGIIKSAVVEESKTGNETMTLTFELNNVWSSDTSSWEVLDSPTTRDVFFSFADKAFDYTMRKLKSLSWNNDLEGPEFTDEPVELRMKVEAYEGKDRESWELAQWGKREIKKASASKLRGLKARIKATAPSEPAVSTAPKPAKSGPPPAPTSVASEDTNGEMTKDKAWGLCFDACETEDKAAEVWKRCVNEVGDNETRFTTGDWDEVAKAVVIPF